MNVQTVYGGAFDNENAAVEAAIKTRHKAKLGKVEAVVEFAFTVGVEETDAMASKQVLTTIMSPSLHRVCCCNRPHRQDSHPYPARLDHQWRSNSSFRKRTPRVLLSISTNPS